MVSELNTQTHTVLANSSWQSRVIPVPVLQVNLFVLTVQTPSLILTLKPLKATLLPLINLMEWSQSVKLYVQGKGKFGYLSGSMTKPKIEDEGYEKWEAENSMIMSWLVNSMEPSLGRTYLFLPTANAIWSAVKETYSDLGNAGQLFEIKTRLRKAKQGEKSVTQYYTDLKTLWQELDLYCNYEWSCPQDSAFYQKTVEKESSTSWWA